MCRTNETQNVLSRHRKASRCVDIQHNFKYFPKLCKLNDNVDIYIYKLRLERQSCKKKSPEKEALKRVTSQENLTRNSGEVEKLRS